MKQGSELFLQGRLGGSLSRKYEEVGLSLALGVRLYTDLLGDIWTENWPLLLSLCCWVRGGECASQLLTVQPLSPAEHRHFGKSLNTSILCSRI